MKWLDRKRADVIRRWKANEVSLADAARDLTQLGVAPLEAWRILESVR